MISHEPLRPPTLPPPRARSRRRGRSEPVATATDTTPAATATDTTPGARDLPRTVDQPAVAPQPAAVRRTRPPGIRRSLLVVLAALVLWPAALRLLSWWSAAPAGAGWLRHGAVALAVATLGVLAWRARLYRTLTSLPFSVALLGTLLAATVLGTVVLQGGAPEEYAARYGVLAPGLLALGIDHLFHAAWFDGLLGLLCLSLALTGTRRAVWRLPMLGHVLCHLGVVVVLVGGLVGKTRGFRGVVDLHEGQTASEAWITENGVPTGQRIPLGFALRLDDFEIERYAPEYRLYAYERDGDSFRRTSSYDVEASAGWTELADDFAFRVRAVYPDLALVSELVPRADGAPALALAVGNEPEVHLLAGVAGRDALELADGALAVRLLREPPGEDELAARAARRAERHRVSWRDPESGATRWLDVRPGETHALAAGLTLRVADFLPDFVYDSEAKRAATRSERPRNPALRVALDGPEGTSEAWLFASLPDYRAAHGGEADALALTYAYEPARAPLARELLVVAGKGHGDGGEAWLLEHGLLRERLPLAAEGPLPGLADARYRLLASAVEVRRATSASERWEHPAVELELRRPEGLSTRLVGAAHGDPVWLPDGEHVLLFERKPNDVKAYRSHVRVLVDGRPVESATIEVNTPLAFGGLHVYQTNYREEDPTYSGFQVVRDPGLGLVFLGFVMLSLGVVFVYYVRPRLLHGGAS